MFFPFWIQSILDTKIADTIWIQTGYNLDTKSGYNMDTIWIQYGYKISISITKYGYNMDTIPDKI
jgi:hypothetical protein